MHLNDATNHDLIINESNDKGHGHIERRIAAVGQICATVWRKGKETTETRVYISSIALTAQKLNEVARAHWSIENQLHWVLDLTFN